MIITYSNHFKYKLATKAIHLGTDTIKACLLRDGFIFDPDVFEIYKHISANSGPITVSFLATDKSINRIVGSFLSDGFAPGNQISTTASSNPGPFTVSSVTALKIIVLETIAIQSGVVIITCYDELQTGYGYVRNEKVLSGVTLTEDDTNNWLEMVCNNIIWTAVAGSIGPTSGLILYDDSSSDDTIICHVDLGGTTIINDGMDLKIQNLKLRILGDGSNHSKMRFAQKAIDLQTDTIKLLLMRSGFSFNQDNHERKKNIKTNSGAISIIFDAAGKTITRGADSFLTDGFVIGNRITADAALNPGPFTITNVIALVITVSETVVNEGPVTKTVTSDDEIPTGGGYTQDSLTLANKVVTEDDANNWAQMACDTVNIYALGGTIGPTLGVILYDDTDPDDTILGFFSFGVDKTAVAGDNFLLQQTRIRMP